ncbi:MAG: ABC transporter permease [Spirochaetales bacterium]
METQLSSLEKKPNLFSKNIDRVSPSFFYLFFRKFLRLLLTMFLIPTIVFFILRVIPGDPAFVVAGMDASPEVVENLRVQLGTDKPVFIQYEEWLLDVFQLHLGQSLISHEPVTKLILDRFPVTLSLAVLGMVCALFIALPLGVISAVRRWTLWDYLGMIFAQIGIALPSFWLGILLLLLLAVKYPIFPLFGGDTPYHLVLPALALGINRGAVLLRLVRTSMIEELEKEYVIAARSKGLPEVIVRYRHALRNALLPVLTIAGIQFGYMLGGAIVLEQVFSLPGLGRLLLTAVFQRDFPVIQGGTLFIAAVFSLVNFIVDLFYSLVNPRIRVT